MPENLRGDSGLTFFQPGYRRELTNYGRIAILSIVTAGLAVALAVVAFASLYLAAIEQQKTHLKILVENQRSVIVSVANLQAPNRMGTYVGGATSAAVAQVNASLKYADKSVSSDILLAIKSDEQIRYMARSRGHERTLPKPVPFEQEADAAMFLALGGGTGFIQATGADGIRYLSAYTYLPHIKSGLVARASLSEIRLPYRNAAILTVAGIIVVILLSFFLFRRFSAPLIAKLEQAANHLEEGQRLADFGSWYMNFATGQIEWSVQIYKILGIASGKQEPSVEQFIERIHDEDRANVQRAIQTAKEKGEGYSLEYRIVRPDGEVRYVESQAYIALSGAGDVISMRGFINDVTIRKWAELALIDLNKNLEQRVETRTRALKTAIAEHEKTQLLLQQREAQIRSVVETAADGIVTISRSGIISNFNNAAEKIFRWSADDVIGKNISMLMPAGDAVHHDRYLKETKDTPGLSIIGSSRELRGLRSDGTTFPLELAVSASEIAGDQMFTGIIRDISERKAFEAELERNEKRLRDAMDNMPGAMAFVDENLQIVVASSRYADLCEVPRNYLEEGRPFCDHLRLRAERGDYGGGDPEQILETRMQILKEPTDDLYELPTPSGRINGFSRRPADGGGQVFVVADITDGKLRERELEETVSALKDTQNSLVQAEKMASLGGLVAGVAHEINTPVGIAVTAASHLEDISKELEGKLGRGELSREDLDTYLTTTLDATQFVSSNLHRAADLIRSFKQVAVDQSSEENREFTVLPYLEQILMSLQPHLKRHKHVIKIDCAPDLVIDSQPGALAQIMTNLIMNSVIHGFVDTEIGHIDINVKELGSDIQIIYRDDGVGMDEETVSKVFDPFFTTNRGGGGSGLGMNIVFNLVSQALGGSLNCASSPGEGAEFTAVFPKKTPQDN